MGQIRSSDVKKSLAESTILAGAALGAPFIGTAIGNMPIGIFLSIFTLAAGLSLFDRLGLYRLGPVRSFFYKKLHGYEGFWYSRSEHATRVHNISKIYFNWKKLCWRQRGFAFDKEGQCVAQWVSDSIYLDSKDRWYFRGEWSADRPNWTRIEGKNLVSHQLTSGDFDQITTHIVDNFDEPAQPQSGVIDQRVQTVQAYRIPAQENTQYLSSRGRIDRLDHQSTETILRICNSMQHHQP